MKVLRSASLACAILAVCCGITFAQDTPLPPEFIQAMLQAKSVYVVTGHVQYLKTKGIIKHEWVDSTPFEEPCRKELENWGRFQFVSDVKSADLIVRVYGNGTKQAIPVADRGSAVLGPALGPTFVILDVVQPSSKKILWFASKNLGTSWSTNTAVAGLVKNLREYVEEQQKSGASSTPAGKAPAGRQP